MKQKIKFGDAVGIALLYFFIWGLAFYSKFGVGGMIGDISDWPKPAIVMAFIIAPAIFGAMLTVWFGNLFNIFPEKVLRNVPMIGE
jgi:hypothetical protein